MQLLLEDWQLVQDTGHPLLGVASLPPVALASLIAYNVIYAALGLAFGRAAALLVLHRTRLAVVSTTFDRERLITCPR